MFVLFGFFITNVSQASQCVLFLGNKDLKTSQPRLSIQPTPSAQQRLFRFKVEELKTNLTLKEVSQYLHNNGVLHEVKGQQIVILPLGTTPLNKFALRLSRASRASGMALVSGVTQLIFDFEAVEDVGFSGEFRYWSQMINGQETGMLHNAIILSVEALLQLKPTSTEFHELVHWKAYFRKAQLKVDSLIYGQVDLGDMIKIKDQKSHTEAQTQSYSIEELKAHLLVLSKKLRALNATQNNALKAKLRTEIANEVWIASYYASGIEHVLEYLTKKSVFYKMLASKENGDDYLIVQEESLEAFNFDWIETFELVKGYEGSKKVNTLEYHFIRNEDVSWIYFALPMPKGFSRIKSFKSINKQTLQKLQLKVAKALELRVYYLMQLTQFIDDLELMILDEEPIDFSPIEVFHKLDNEYRAKLHAL